MRRLKTHNNRAARRRELEPKVTPATNEATSFRLPWISGWVLLLLVLVPIAGIAIRWRLGDLAWFSSGVYWRHGLAAFAILCAFEVFKESAWRRRERQVHRVRAIAGASAGLMAGLAYSPTVGGVLMGVFIGVLGGLAFDLIVRK